MKKFLVVVLLCGVLLYGGCQKTISEAEVKEALAAARTDCSQALRAYYMGQGDSQQVQKFLKEIQRLERYQI